RREKSRWLALPDRPAPGARLSAPALVQAPCPGTRRSAGVGRRRGRDSCGPARAQADGSPPRATPRAPARRSARRLRALRGGGILWAGDRRAPGRPAQHRVGADPCGASEAQEAAQRCGGGCVMKRLLDEAPDAESQELARLVAQMPPLEINPMTQRRIWVGLNRRRRGAPRPRAFTLLAVAGLFVSGTVFATLGGRW